jgi:hypothetical protein
VFFGLDPHKSSSRQNREDTVVVFGKATKPPTVSLLLESLQQTLDFQAQLCQKYQCSVGGKFKPVRIKSDHCEVK